MDWLQIGMKVGANLDRRSERAAQHFHHIADKTCDIDCFGPEFLTPRECQHALGQAGSALGSLYRAVDKAKDPRTLRQMLLHHCEIAEHRRQQVVEIMCPPAGKLAEAFELLHLMHLR